MQIWKGKKSVSLFEHDITLYLKVPNDFTRKFFNMIKTLSKIERNKMNILKSITILYSKVTFLRKH